MKQVKIITAEEAALLVKDGDVVTTNGFVGSGQPEALTSALEARFLETGAPKDLTLIYAASQGNTDGRGGDHFAHEGMLKKAILGHWNAVTALQKLVNENKIQAYNLPQGTLSQYFRDVAAHRLGTITHVGLETFADPRVTGGRLNDVTKEDFVKVIEIDGHEQLFYPRMDMNIGFIRGTYADEWGNVVLSKEVSPFDATPLAQAVHNSGGTATEETSSGMPIPRLITASLLILRSRRAARRAITFFALSGAGSNALTGTVTSPVKDGSYSQSKDCCRLVSSSTWTT